MDSIKVMVPASEEAELRSEFKKYGLREVVHFSVNLDVLSSINVCIGAGGASLVMLAKVYIQYLNAKNCKKVRITNFNNNTLELENLSADELAEVLKTTLKIEMVQDKKRNGLKETETEKLSAFE